MEPKKINSRGIHSLPKKNHKDFFTERIKSTKKKR